jgi:hypothetical protein
MVTVVGRQLFIDDTEEKGQEKYYKGELMTHPSNKNVYFTY